MGQFLSTVFANAIGALLATFIIAAFKHLKNHGEATHKSTLIFALTFGVTFYIVNEIALRLLLRMLSADMLSSDLEKWKLIIATWVISLIAISAGGIWIQFIVPFANRLAAKYLAVDRNEVG